MTVHGQADERSPRLSVVVPCFNESAIVRASFATLDRFLSDLGMPFEVVWVDDGSVDGTRAVLDDLAAAGGRHRAAGLRRCGPRDAPDVRG